MAFMQCYIRSSVLGKGCNLNVLLPQAYEADGVTPKARQTYKVLYLLHGLSDDYSSWMRRTSIERYLEKYNVAAIMPDVDRSFYTDMKKGLKYWQFISEELPGLVKQLFPVSTCKEDTYVAGFSMGGYGALKLALTYSERFAACAALSGAVDIRARFELGDRHEQGVAIWGEDYVNAIPGSPDDTYALARRLEEAGKPKPWIYQACGTEDKRLRENHLFRDFIRDRGYTYEYYEGPGRHDWDFWRAQLPILLDFFLNCMKEK